MALSSKFLTDLVSKLPEADRGTVEAVLAKTEAADAVKFADDAAKRQSDYSRGMDELAQSRARLEQDRTNLTEWYNQYKPVLDLGLAAHTAGWKPGQPDPDPDPNPSPTKVELPPDLIRKGEIETLLNEREVGAATFFAVLNDMSIAHLQSFGERLDTKALLADPRLKQLGLEGLYQAKFGERLQAKAKEAEDKRINDLVAAKLAEERKNLHSRPPYPVGSTDPSPLDALKTKADPNQYSPDAMADEYVDLVNKTVGAGT